MQTLPNQARIVLVALLVVLSAVLVVPAASAATSDVYAQTAADDEPNDTVENATAADTGRAINGEIGTEGDVDYYAISLRENSQVEIGQGIGSSEITMTLLDADGNELASRPPQDVYEGEEDLLIANASDTGTYYLAVEGNPGDEYSIGVDVTEPDASEANDDTASATEVDSDERVVGTLVRGDRDVFAIDADAGEEIRVIGNATAAADVTVYGPDESALDGEALPSPGDVFEAEQGYGTPVVTATAEESGTYYVAVEIGENDIGNVNGPYNITVTTSGDGESAESAEDTTIDESTDDGSDATDTSGDATDTDTTETSSSDSDAASPTDGGSDANADAGEPTTTATGTANTDQTATEEDTENDGSDATTTAGDTTTANAETTATTESETATPGTEATTDAPSTSPGTATATGGTGDVSEDVERTAVNGPGFGIVAALVALVGAALLATRRN